ncbi:MAG TPA: HAMP domain-containing protein [Acidobacteriota bacterium]|nr:HAMP domain-containing protein [Acidobacteriota bacterium]HNB71513.1 HAMP domain-containing protein [Acidobacteriota bacterium]HND20549.1 HAMP domain-containing protein [Acidobacteriota bacterium]HNG91278.1 HAMP domain-containing protein [Acidobacteriota bacterium]HNH80903.1 HAMP domain-containing protein [Acidobacteriota bacterium]
MKLNIRNKLIIFAALLVFTPLALSAIAILLQVKGSIEDNAKKNIEKDARLAEKIYKGRQQIIKEIAQNLAQAISAENLLESAQTPSTPASGGAAAAPSSAAVTAQQSQLRGKRRIQELMAQRQDQVDFLIVTDKSGKVLLTNKGEPKGNESKLEDPLVLKSKNNLDANQFADAALGGSVRVDAEALKSLELDSQLVKPGSSGLAIEGAAPILAGERSLGLVIAGVLLDNAKQDRSIAAEIKEAMYSDLPSEAAAAVLNDTKTIISANFPSDSGKSAVGQQIKRELLIDRPVAGTDNVHEIDYKSAFMPLKDPDGKNVGYVGVAIKESWFSAVINRVLLIIVAIFVVVLGLAIFAAFYFSQRLTQPIILLTEASNRISLGELDEAIAVGGSDEIGQLAESLERMRISLKSAIERLRRR